MKTSSWCIVHFVLLTFVAGCVSADKNKESSKLAGAVPITVIYHVKPGFEDRLEKLLDKARAHYLLERTVCTKPYLRLKMQEGDNQYRIVEVYAWSNPSAFEYQTDSTKQILSELDSLCEPRRGLLSIEYRFTEVLVPRGLEFYR